jgi:hypothetical protein
MGTALFVTCLLLQAAHSASSPRPEQAYVHELWHVKGSASVPISPKSKALARKDGSFWLTLPTTCQFILVRPGGQYGAPWGGCGTAAGQFRDMSAAGTYHDTLWIWDRAINQLSLFWNGPHPRRMLRFDFSGTSLRGSQVPLVSALVAKNVVLAHQPSKPQLFDQRDTGATSELLMTLTLDGSSTSVELPIRGSSTAYLMHVRRPKASPAARKATLYFVSPFPPGTMTAIARDGGTVVVLHQEEDDARADPHRFSISVFDSTLHQVRQWSIPFTPLVTDRDRITSAVKTFHNSVRRAGLSLSAGQREWADAAFHAPAFERPVDALGPLSANMIWLKRGPSTGKIVTWERMSLASGAYVSITLRRGIEIIGASDT